MREIGYALSSEEHGPRDLVRNAVRAEEAGFTFALVSDHFPPWVDRQGHSPFVWSVLGGIATATERLRVGTGVTCPIIRIHPAIIAQAAATTADMMPGRFFLGVGTGENLNEHITGERWPPAAVRREMLEEAVDVIRLLWTGRNVSHRGAHYTVENARIYTLPEEPPPIYVAASGRKSSRLAGAIGDGLVGVAPRAGTVEEFRAAGGEGKPAIAQATVCYHEDEREARRIALEWWPNAGVPGQLSQELPQPALFEQAAERVSEDDLCATITCGPDPERHIAGIREFFDAGYDQVYVHQVGPRQEAFFRFYEEQVLPKLR